MRQIFVRRTSNVLRGVAFLRADRNALSAERSTISSTPTFLYHHSLLQDQKLHKKFIERDIGIQILDVGLAVHEHDLIAALTACVFPLFLSSLSVDCRERKRMMVPHQIGAWSSQDRDQERQHPVPRSSLNLPPLRSPMHLDRPSRLPRRTEHCPRSPSHLRPIQPAIP